MVLSGVTAARDAASHARTIHTSGIPDHDLPSITPPQVRTALLLRDEIALLDVRHEAVFATGHPLFAANMAADGSRWRPSAAAAQGLRRSFSMMTAKASCRRRRIG
jgi:hypothetical protein